MTSPWESPPASRDFAILLATALARSGLTLEGISKRLGQAGTPVSVATLSYWQTGKNTPRRLSSLQAIDELERLLALPSGALRQTLPGGERDRTEVIRPAVVELDQALAELGLDTQNWQGMTSTDLVVLGPNGSERSIAHHQVAKAQTDGLSRVPAIYFQDADEPMAPSIRAAWGCRTGRQVTVPELHLAVTELLLPRPLARDEVHSFCYQVECAPNHTRSLRFQRALRSHHQEFVVHVLFRGKAPSRASRYYQRHQDDAILVPPELAWEYAQQPVEIHDGQLQVALVDAPIGIHGVAWEWD